MAKAARFRESRLHRRRAFVEEKACFLLVCEGRNSEPLYFASLGRTLKATVVEIIRGAGTPDAVAELAVEESKKRGLTKRRGAPSRDQVWAVFDRDTHERFDEAVQLCSTNSIHVARSNPCFEVWLVLHVEEFERPDGRAEVYEYFCELRPDYKRGKGRGCDFADLQKAIDEAERRAEKQLLNRDKDGNPYGEPSTTVFQLTRALRGREKR